ncbi:MAG: CobW family GTP-binding protein, partial [Acetobacteraceae bacterium]
TFFVDEGVREKTRLDAVVTVVDAKNLAARLDDSTEAAAQIAFADVIVLNKTDLVSVAELAEVERRIRTINRFARILPAERGNVPIEALLDQGAFDLKRAVALEPGFLDGEDEHTHNEDVASMSFEVERPIDPEKFSAWISALLAERGPDLLRTKGILAYPGEDRRFAFQAVHMIADGDFIGPWREGEPRRSRIVFIGRNLSRPLLRRGFEATQAA